MTYTNNKKVAIGLSIVVIVGLALYLSKNPESFTKSESSFEDSDFNNTEVSVNPVPTSNKYKEDSDLDNTQVKVTPVATNNNKYKDGTYMSVGNYNSPAGRESIDISLTLSDGIVTDATFVGNATNPASKNKQKSFDNNFKLQVVGKNIEDIDLHAVGGASLTTGAFMQALLDIESQAKA